MNCTEGEDAFDNIGGVDRILESLEKYINLCSGKDDISKAAPQEDADLQEGASCNKTRAKSERDKSKKSVFPNLAGFCRYLGISTGELEELLAEHQCEYDRILTVLEDEALNSELSTMLVSAYLKKRLGYDSASRTASASVPQLKIKFEHDIFEDGE